MPWSRNPFGDHAFVWLRFSVLPVSRSSQKRLRLTREVLLHSRALQLAHRIHKMICSALYSKPVTCANVVRQVSVRALDFGVG